MSSNTIAIVSSSVLGLYFIATAIGNGWPSTRVGKLCLRFACILGAIEKALPQSQQVNLIRGRLEADRIRNDSNGS